jgi:hypothetical protein
MDYVTLYYTRISSNRYGKIIIGVDLLLSHQYIVCGEYVMAKEWVADEKSDAYLVCHRPLRCKVGMDSLAPYVCFKCDDRLVGVEQLLCYRMLHMRNGIGLGLVMRLLDH